MMAFHSQWQTCNGTVHGTLALAYIESTITGNLDKQQQSMATNQAPVIRREDGKQSSSTSAQKRQSKHQYLAQKRQTKNQYLAQFAFIQILLPAVYYHSFYCHPMKTWGLNMFPVDSKDSGSSFHLADTCLSHLSFTSLYSLYTCERHSIRNVSNLLIC